jgi:hypothetical protein
LRGAEQQSNLDRIAYLVAGNGFAALGMTTTFITIDPAANGERLDRVTIT